MSVAQGTIVDLNSQIGSYKDKLNGASPDQAAARISALQAELNRTNAKLQVLMPDVKRHLTETQKRFFLDHAKEFKSIPGAGNFVYAWSEGDSPQYANDFVKAFKAIGIDSGGTMTTFCDDTQHGVMVGIPVEGHPSKDASKFMALLKNMGLSPQYTYWDTDPKAEPNFDLFICR